MNYLTFCDFACAIFYAVWKDVYRTKEAAKSLAASFIVCSPLCGFIGE